MYGIQGEIVLPCTKDGDCVRDTSGRGTANNFRRTSYTMYLCTENNFVVQYMTKIVHRINNVLFAYIIRRTMNNELIAMCFTVYTYSIQRPVKV